VDAFAGVPQFVDMVHGVLASCPPLSVGELTLDGTAVAEILSCKPGKIVGEALRFLLGEVIRDPSLNKPHRLTMVLVEHASEFRR
jgi:hypothetical protein